MSLPLVVIDSKEGLRGSSKKIVDSLQSSSKIRVEIQNLGDAVDYLIPKEIGMCGIQRKKVTEMGGKAVLRDVREMLLMDGMTPYLLLEGNWKSLKYTKYAKNMIVNRLYEVCHDCNVKVLPSGDVGYSIKWILYMATHFGVDREIDLRLFRGGIPGYFQLMGFRKSLKEGDITREEYLESTDSIIRDAGVYLLTGLPGISKVLATRLLEKYGTPINAISNYEKWSEEVFGFGKKKTGLARRILTKDHIKIEEKEIE